MEHVNAIPGSISSQYSNFLICPKQYYIFESHGLVGLYSITSSTTGDNLEIDQMNMDRCMKKNNTSQHCLKNLQVLTLTVRPSATAIFQLPDFGHATCRPCQDAVFHT